MALMFWVARVRTLLFVPGCCSLAEDDASLAFAGWHGLAINFACFLSFESLECQDCGEQATL